MEGQRIEFTIRPDGTVEEKVSGVQGPECEDVTRAIENALGKVAERKHTASFYRNREEQAENSANTSA